MAPQQKVMRFSTVLSLGLLHCAPAAAERGDAPLARDLDAGLERACAELPLRLPVGTTFRFQVGLTEEEVPALPRTTLPSPGREPASPEGGRASLGGGLQPPLPREAASPSPRGGAPAGLQRRDIELTVLSAAPGEERAPRASGAGSSAAGSSAAGASTAERGGPGIAIASATLSLRVLPVGGALPSGQERARAFRLTVDATGAILSFDPMEDAQPATARESKEANDAREPSPPRAGALDEPEAVRALARCILGSGLHERVLEPGRGYVLEGMPRVCGAARALAATASGAVDAPPAVPSLGPLLEGLASLRWELEGTASGLLQFKLLDGSRPLEGSILRRAAPGAARVENEDHDEEASTLVPAGKLSSGPVVGQATFKAGDGLLTGLTMELPMERGTPRASGGEAREREGEDPRVGLGPGSGAEADEAGRSDATPAPPGGRSTLLRLSLRRRD